MAKKTAGDMWGIGGLVSLLVIIAVGSLVTYTITGSLTRTANSFADNAINNVESQGATAFSLAALLAIVVVAATIIGVVVSALGRGG